MLEGGDGKRVKRQFRTIIEKSISHGTKKVKELERRLSKEALWLGEHDRVGKVGQSQ